MHRHIFYAQCIQCAEAGFSTAKHLDVIGIKEFPDLFGNTIWRVPILLTCFLGGHEGLRSSRCLNQWVGVASYPLLPYPESP